MSQEEVSPDQPLEQAWPQDPADLADEQNVADEAPVDVANETVEAYAEAEEVLATEEIAASGFRAPEPEELAPWFPQYEIGYLIAVGGMGAVYRAVQKSLDRTVAIKVLPTEFSQDAEFCRSFQSEAKAMAKLNHSNLIGVYDFGEAGGQLFIVMELVEGHSLHDACHGGALDQYEAIRLMEGICAGLAHAHENGVLHRDIKPANILLGADQVPKIGDFGLARAAGTRIEEGEVIFGTPGYTAPEVLQPPHEFDHRADIFSLGAMLHELLTGKIPDADPRPASAQVRSDPRLDAIIRKAMHPQPSKRYNDAMEMAKDLSKVAHSTRSKVMVGAGRSTHVGGPRLARSPYPTLTQTRSGGGMLWLFLILLIALVGYLLRDQIMEVINPAPPPPAPANPTHGAGSTPYNTNPGSSGTRPPKPNKSHPPHSTSGGSGEFRPKNPKDPGANPTMNWEPENAPLVRVKPERKPGSAEHPEVDPIAASLPAPRLDVEPVFERARSAMAERCKPFHDDYRQAISELRSEFARNGRPLLELENSRGNQAQLRARFEKFVDALKEQKLAVHEVVLPRSLASNSDIVALYRIYTEKERRMEADYEEALQRQVTVYADALKKSAAQLKASNDKGAARKLEWEAERAEADLGYFRRMMESRW
ncbi:MAG TPA: serine/threonine-protein kinase [Luteolibacter sp.]|nr:serine/threonine-protein kinase [Luteolibacter sp.]